MFRGQRWDGDWKHYRPDYNGDQREGNFPNVRWLDEGGVIHQASAHNNLTLCELNKQFSLLMHWVIVAPTRARVTCVACISYPTWHEYPTDEGEHADHQRHD